MNNTGFLRLTPVLIFGALKTRIFLCFQMHETYADLSNICYVQLFLCPARLITSAGCCFCGILYIVANSEVAECSLVAKLCNTHNIHNMKGVSLTSSLV